MNFYGVSILSVFCVFVCVCLCLCVFVFVFVLKDFYENLFTRSLFNANP